MTKTTGVVFFLLAVAASFPASGVYWGCRTQERWCGEPEGEVYHDKCLAGDLIAYENEYKSDGISARVPRSWFLKVAGKPSNDSDDRKKKNEETEQKRKACEKLGHRLHVNSWVRDSMWRVLPHVDGDPGAKTPRELCNALKNEILGWLEHVCEEDGYCVSPEVSESYQEIVKCEFRHMGEALYECQSIYDSALIQTIEDKKRWDDLKCAWSYRCSCEDKNDKAYSSLEACVADCAGSLACMLGICIKGITIDGRW
jgi:hypothetical protein